MLDAYCAKLPKEPWGFEAEHLDPEGMSIDSDIFMSRLVDEFETNAKLKKLCKTKTLFRLKDDKNPDDFFNHSKFGFRRYDPLRLEPRKFSQ